MIINKSKKKITISGSIQTLSDFINIFFLLFFIPQPYSFGINSSKEKPIANNTIDK